MQKVFFNYLAIRLLRRLAMSKRLLTVFLIIGVTLSVSLFAGSHLEDAHTVSDSRPSPIQTPPHLVHTRGVVRVTLLSVCEGVAYRKKKQNAIVEEFGDTPVPYLRVLFLVEKLGKPKGGNGSINVIGPNVELTFRTREWGPANIKMFNSYWADMVRLPNLGDDTTEALIYKQMWSELKGPGPFPHSLTITARFFGEDFRFENIEMP
jgi:hypothetical protein